jgi:hypothetical protein
MRYLLAAALPLVAALVAGPVAPDGTEVQNDLPRPFHVRNRGGSDGAGLCVFASLQQSACWQDVEPLTGIFEWMTTKPGGGWPEKVDRVVDEMCRAKKIKKPAYLQIEGTDFELLRRACQTGRIPAVTYAFSPSGRYGKAKIAHMVNLLHADERWCAILDNNFPGTIEWMTPAEFERVWTGGGKGWAVILLADGPPPPPIN